MKVLLVGGSGHVGSLVVPYLREHHELRVLDPNPPRHDIEFVKGSITSPDDLARAMDGMDAFVDLVMRRGQGATETDQTLEEITDHYAVNALGVHLLLLTAHQAGVNRGVYTSSLSVHHRARDWYPSEELVPLDSPSVYGLTKGFGELVCQYFARWFDMNLLALRISAPRSRHQWRLERTSPPSSVGDRLHATHEADLADAYLRALRAVQVGRGRFDAVFIVGDNRGETHNLSKAEQMLGWRPRSADETAP